MDVLLRCPVENSNPLSERILSSLFLYNIKLQTSPQAFPTTGNKLYFMNLKPLYHMYSICSLHTIPVDLISIVFPNICILPSRKKRH
jgi:hypothetical protein